MLTGVNRIKTTGRAGYLTVNAIPPTSTGAVASSRGARDGGLAQWRSETSESAKQTAPSFQFWLVQSYQRMSNIGTIATLGKLPGSELVAVPL